MNSSNPSDSRSPAGISRAESTTLALRIVCIDRALDEDLMFAATLVRHLERVRDRPPMLLVVGSGEAVDRAVSAGGPLMMRERGQIRLETEEERAVFDRAMREYGRRLVGQLSDAGIPAVAFFGMDRRLLCVKSDGSVTVSGIETLTGFTRSGVVSLLLCSARDWTGRICDVHPILVCNSIQRILLENNANILPDIVLTVSRLPESLSANAERSLMVSWSDVQESGLRLTDELAEFAAKAAHPFNISTVSNVGRVSQIRVGV